MSGGMVDSAMGAAVVVLHGLKSMAAMASGTALPRLFEREQCESEKWREWRGSSSLLSA
jgi:hypothetical protein